MKTTTFLILSLVLFASFNQDNNSSKVVLFAEDTFEDVIYTKLDFTLFSDSIFVFNHHSNEWRHKKDEMFRGRYYIKSDTIHFFPFNFGYIQSNKAIINNGFLEFLDGKRPLKIKIRSSILNIKTSFDSSRFKKYAVFSYNPDHYSCFREKVQPTSLDNEDITKIDALLKSCFSYNSNLTSRKPEEYYKQCIPIIDANGDKVVWVNLECSNRYYEYFINTVYDGGDCYANLKINLTKMTFSDFWVNGEG